MGHIDRVLRLGPPLKTNVQNILCKDPRLDSVQVRNNYLKNRTWQGLHFFFRNQVWVSSCLFSGATVESTILAPSCVPLHKADPVARVPLTPQGAAALPDLLS